MLIVLVVTHRTAPALLTQQMVGCIKAMDPCVKSASAELLVLQSCSSLTCTPSHVLSAPTASPESVHSGEPEDGGAHVGVSQGAAAHSGRTHWNYLLKTLKPYRICPTYAVRVHHTVGTGSGMILICHKHTYALNATLSQYTYTEQTQVSPLYTHGCCYASTCCLGPTRGRARRSAHTLEPL